MDAAADAVRSQHKDAPESPFTTEFAMEVLAEIRQSALEAFRSLPYGGLEVGGVLFGRVSPSGRNPKRVEVSATRAMECDHAAGPAFILSGTERVRLAQMFENARQEEELAALSVVGFWVSHGRSELGLTTHDADLYRAFFPHSWQIALMLKPESRAPLREALFCRVDGRIVPYRRPSELAVVPSVAVAVPIVAVPEDAAPVVEAAVPVVEEPVMAEPMVEEPVVEEPMVEAAEAVAPVVAVAELVEPVIEEPVAAVAMQEEVAVAPEPEAVPDPVQETKYLVPDYREQALSAVPEPSVAKTWFPEPVLFHEAFAESVLAESPVVEAPVVAAVVSQEPTYVKPTAPEMQRFATDIYLPAPPVEPPSVKPWPKDLYRPAGRARALVQPSPAVEPVTKTEPPAVAEPEMPEAELTAPVPRLKSYWEKDAPAESQAAVAPEAAVVPEPVQVAVVEEKSFEQNWPRQVILDHAPEAEVEEPIIAAEAELQPVEVLNAVDYDPNIPPSFAPPVVTPPALPVAEAAPVVVEPEAIPEPAFARGKAPATDIYVAPKLDTPKVESKPETAPPPAEIGDELARLLVSIRAATGDSRGARFEEEEAEEVGRSSRFSKHSFGLVTVALLMLVGLAVGGVLGFWFFGNHQLVAAKAPGPDLGLEMFNTGKEVLIHWEAKSPLVLHARTAELRIHDSGMVQTLLLDLSGLSKGYYRYQPTSSDVQTTLIVTENDGHTEQSIASRFSE